MCQKKKPLKKKKLLKNFNTTKHAGHGLMVMGSDIIIELGWNG